VCCVPSGFPASESSQRPEFRGAACRFSSGADPHMNIDAARQLPFPLDNRRTQRRARWADDGGRQYGGGGEPPARTGKPTGRPLAGDRTAPTLPEGFAIPGLLDSPQESRRQVTLPAALGTTQSK